MLPILRILPVGGVLLATLILLLALAPGGVRRALPDSTLEARGPLIDRDSHPEWRQFLMQAALQRADELNHLRDLPDTPNGRDAPETPGQTEIVIPLPAPVTHTEEVAPQQPAADAIPTAPKPATAIDAQDASQVIAALPTDRSDTDTENDDVTGTITELPGATIPIDIGETSSTELPVVLPEERPPVIRTPQRAKPPRESRRKPVHRTRRAKAAPKVAPKPQPPQVNLFEVLFGGFTEQRRELYTNSAITSAAPSQFGVASQ
jgi:hypothetical protein